MFGPLLEVEMFERLASLWREAHFEVKIYKTHQVPSTFGSWDIEKLHTVVARCGFAWQAQRIPYTLPKVSKSWEFCSSFNNVRRRGTFEDDLQRCISLGRGSTRDMFIRDVRRSGRWFPDMGCIFEHETFRFAKMILRDRCCTSYDLASPFRDRRSTLDRWSGKIANSIGTRPSASALKFPCSKQVSQNCCVFDAVNCEKWGSLAEFCVVFDAVNVEIEEVS